MNVFLSHEGSGLYVSGKPEAFMLFVDVISFVSVLVWTHSDLHFLVKVYGDLWLILDFGQLPEIIMHLM